MTDSEIVNAWAAYLDEKGKSAHTVAAYQRGMEHFIAWNKQSFNIDFDPAAIIPRDIEDWKTYQQTVEKASPATTNQRLVALSNFIEWAVSKGHACNNPTAEVGGVIMRKREPKALSEKDLRRLLRAVHAAGDARDIAMVELLVGTGLRVGELLALKVGDLVLNDRSGKVIVRMGKHNNYREIPLTAPVR
jgi:site-specific recombinase XerD